MIIKTEMRSKTLTTRGRKCLRCKHRNRMQINLASILSMDHACQGCTRVETCCCARYEVCVDAKELNRIIQVLPEVVKLCPHLRTAGGYDNVFDEVEPGIYAIDTTESGLCIFAFVSDHRIRCSLHTVGLTLGIPLAQVKPKACLLWPLAFSEGDTALSLEEDALSFRCNSRRRNPSRRLSPALGEAIGLVYGNDLRAELEKKAKQGVRRAAVLIPAFRPTKPSINTPWQRRRGECWADP